MKLGVCIYIYIYIYIYITASEPISVAYFINLSYQSCVCVRYVYRRIVARQRLGKKNVTAATNTHATIEELLDASFSMPSVRYQRKVGD
jgi:hypothetical protein